MGLKKLSTALLTAALALGLSGLTAATAHADEGTATITGTVTLRGEPISRAYVFAIPRLGERTVSVLADESGAYELSVPPGTYRVEVRGPLNEKRRTRFEEGREYLPTFAGNTVRERDATKFTLGADEVKTVDISTVPAAVVRGKVVGVDGKGLSNVSVWGHNLTRAGSVRTRTDSDGNYVLTGLATGEVEITATRRISRHVTTVDAVQGTTTRAKTFKLDIGRGTLKGTVKGVKKGDLIVAIDTKTGYRYDIVLAEKSGTLKVRKNLGPGTYRLAVDRANVVSKAVRVRSGKSVSAGTIAAPQSRSKVTGIVKDSRGRRFANARVTVFNKYRVELAEKWTDAKGRYTVSGLGRGTYRIVAEDWKDHNAPKEVTLTLAKGTKVKQNFRLRKAYTITGQIVHQGAPVARVNVYGLTAGDRHDVDFDLTDSDGRFRLSGFARGKARIHVHDDTTGGFLDRRKTVTVTPDGAELTLTVK